MARRIAVLQSDCSLISHRIKRCQARNLLAQGTVVWVEEGVSVRAVTRHDRVSRAGYVPERLPPVELPGIHFVEPDSASWREAHRRVCQI